MVNGSCVHRAPQAAVTLQNETSREQFQQIGQRGRRAAACGRIVEDVLACAVVHDHQSFAVLLVCTTVLHQFADAVVDDLPQPGLSAVQQAWHGSGRVRGVRQHVKYGGRRTWRARKKDGHSQ